MCSCFMYWGGCSERSSVTDSSTLHAIDDPLSSTNVECVTPHLPRQNLEKFFELNDSNLIRATALKPFDLFYIETNMSKSND